MLDGSPGPHLFSIAFHWTAEVLGCSWDSVMMRFHCSVSAGVRGPSHTQENSAVPGVCEPGAAFPQDKCMNEQGGWTDLGFLN